MDEDGLFAECARGPWLSSSVGLGQRLLEACRISQLESVSGALHEHLYSLLLSEDDEAGTAEADGDASGT